jgi:uncharacterized membrane protein YgcG
MDKNWINIEPRIKNELKNLKPEATSSDWDKMALLLDQDESAGFWFTLKAFILKYLTFKTLIIMTTSTLLAGLILSLGLTDSPTQNTLSADPDMNNERTVIVPIQPEKITLEENFFSEAVKAEKAPIQTASTRYVDEPKNEEKPKEVVKKETVETIAEEGKKLVQAAKSVLDSPSVQKPMVMKYWVDTTYKYQYHEKSGAIDDFWMGMYFTQQDFIQDSVGLPGRSYGFNFQFMSGNLLNTENIGLYGGLDWGMQFYGKSESHDIELNSSTQERGLTQLAQLSNDLHFKLHLEYAQFPIIPYVNVFAGPKIFSTSQYAESFQGSNEYETSNRINVQNSAALNYGYGLGARVRINSHISLDGRYEWQMNPGVDVASMSGSRFNGRSFDLQNDRLTSGFGQFRFGVVFDLSARDYDKVVDEPGHYEEVIYENVPVQQGDSSTIILPCPCKPCDQNNNSEWDYDNPYMRGGSGGWNGGGGGSGGSGGGSSGGFPGISSPSNH